MRASRRPCVACWPLLGAALQNAFQTGNILGRVGKAHGEMVTATIRTIFARRHFTRSVVIDAAVRYRVA